LLTVMHILHGIRSRNEALFWFGLACLVFAGVCLVLGRLTTTQVFHVNAWIKPFKFAFSTWLFVWAMAWYMHYLPTFDHRWYDWTVIVLLTFEIGYITLRAGQGQLSHFNISTPTNAIFYSLMAGAITVVTLCTAYIGFLFFTLNVAPLEAHYLWAIRAGIILFVLFAFEGFIMGSRFTHTVGGPDGTQGLPLLHWSYTHGDLRIAHFVGMHALQVLPLASFYLLRSTRSTFVLVVAYALLATAVLVLALNGRPLVKHPDPSTSGKDMNATSGP
jgi:hypothetical protein